MKKQWLTLFVILVSLWKTIACQNYPVSFCETTNRGVFKEDLVVFGEIISKDENGINFEIIDILKGVESKTIIRIWNGVDFDCNGNWSMSASQLGEVNETLVIILPKIKEKKSDWDVIGDYRRPDYFGYTPSLKVKNEVVSGFIKGLFISNPYKEEETNYSTFKNSWQTSNNCSSVVLETKNYQKGETINILTLSNNKFKIISKSLKINEIKIFNAIGVKIEPTIFVNKEVEIDLTSYAAGLYFITLRFENHQLKTIKLVKQ